MSVTSKSLKQELENVCVLVTRPAHQAHKLCELVALHGGSALLFPVLEIGEPADPVAMQELLQRLDEFDIAIFISANAVTQALGIILPLRSLPVHLKLATVGMRTAHELEQFGVYADICPSEKFNSEALLEMPEMQDVQGSNILIFRGEGGREFLAETLRRRGAQVEYAEVYRRAKPHSDVPMLLAALDNKQIDIVSVTSNEGLHNLFEMAGAAGQSQLRQLPLVTLSQRCAGLARELGFKNAILVSKEASDEGLIDAIIKAAQGVITL